MRMLGGSADGRSFDLALGQAVAAVGVFGFGAGGVGLG